MKRILLTAFLGAATVYGAVAFNPSDITRRDDAIILLDAPAVQKKAAAADDASEWKRLGTGLFTEVMVSSIYKNVRPVSIPAEVEQSVSDPNTYRMKAPYENWRDHRSEGIFTYDPEKATPLIFHVVNNQYVWFESFDTGLYIDTADDYGPIYGELTLNFQSEALVKGNGFNTVLAVVPGCLAKYDNGTITLDAQCSLSGQSYWNVIMGMTEPENWAANQDGSFRIQLPFAENLDPNMQWTTLGRKALFTDDFTTLLTGPNLDPVYNEWEVEIQQNVADPTLYRLVNPFEGWEDPYKYYNVSYDNSTNHYINIQTFPDYGKACTDRFYTGLSVEGFGEFGIESAAYNFYFTQAIKQGWYFFELADEYPEIFADFNEGVITCPASFATEYPMYMAWMSREPESIYRLNEGGRFKVVFPEAREDDESGDTTGICIPEIGADTTVEYFTLQGVRVERPAKGQLVIERRGANTAKIIF